MRRRIGPHQTFFQDRPTFFLSFARSQPNFRETFAKVACRKGDFPWSTWLEAVKFPNRNGIRAFAQIAGADRGVHRREKHVRTQKCALGCRIRLKPWKFFGRASRALGLSPTVGRRAPNFREISRALRAPQLFQKLSRKSDLGLSGTQYHGGIPTVPLLFSCSQTNTPSQNERPTR